MIFILKDVIYGYILKDPGSRLPEDVLDWTTHPALIAAVSWWSSHHTLIID